MMGNMAGRHGADKVADRYFLILRCRVQKGLVHTDQHVRSQGSKTHSSSCYERLALLSNPEDLRLIDRLKEDRYCVVLL